MIIYKPHPPLFCMCILYNYVVLFMLKLKANKELELDIFEPYFYIKKCVGRESNPDRLLGRQPC